MLPLTNGVPQGSILGPLPFLLYINDLSHNIPDQCFCLLYADDTTLLVKDQDMHTLISNSECCFNSAVKWCNTSDLRINVSKTEKMILSLRRLDHDNPEYVRFLGVRLDLKF
ncbi:hypothetical protein PPYR_02286 [Photinus pyralis]|uniref:Reverse transcriptase domain-containing protein n=1 Tax=Photinus pyralis TaxID=7054 RepID=A0A5N4B6X1_PHOPY|nr:hypothetical protein PPYR_02286 [Photinus pyralis]